MSPPTEPHMDRKRKYYGVLLGAPRGSLTILVISTPVPRCPWHDASHLGLGRPLPFSPSLQMLNSSATRTPGVSLGGVSNDYTLSLFFPSPIITFEFDNSDSCYFS
jgi:hypothetical protein